MISSHLRISSLVCRRCLNASSRLARNSRNSFLIPGESSSCQFCSSHWHLHIHMTTHWNHPARTLYKWSGLDEWTISSGISFFHPSRSSRSLRFVSLGVIFSRNESLRMGFCWQFSKCICSFSAIGYRLPKRIIIMKSNTKGFHFSIWMRNVCLSIVFERLIFCVNTLPQAMLRYRSRYFFPYTHCIRSHTSVDAVE